MTKLEKLELEQIKIQFNKIRIEFGNLNLDNTSEKILIHKYQQLRNLRIRIKELELKLEKQ